MSRFTVGVCGCALVLMLCAAALGDRGTRKFEDKVVVAYVGELKYVEGQKVTQRSVEPLKWTAQAISWLLRREAAAFDASRGGKSEPFDLGIIRMDANGIPEMKAPGAFIYIRTVWTKKGFENGMAKEGSIRGLPIFDEATRTKLIADIKNALQAHGLAFVDDTTSELSTKLKLAAEYLPKDKIEQSANPKEGCVLQFCGVWVVSPHSKGVIKASQAGNDPKQGNVQEQAQRGNEAWNGRQLSKHCTFDLIGLAYPVHIIKDVDTGIKDLDRVHSVLSFRLEGPQGDPHIGGNRFLASEAFDISWHTLANQAQQSLPKEVKGVPGGTPGWVPVQLKDKPGVYVVPDHDTGFVLTASLSETSNWAKVLRKMADMVDQISGL